MLSLCFVFSVLLHTSSIPSGQPFLIPPSPCSSSVEFWDVTGDGTVDEIRVKAESGCNERYEEKLKNKLKGKTISYDHL
jgi:hypothetical protein